MKTDGVVARYKAAYDSYDPNADTELLGLVEEKEKTSECTIS